MSDNNHATLIGSIGVALLLIAFLLNSFKILRSDGQLYMALNFAGAALAGYSSYLISFMPFVLLEGAWALVALLAIVRTLVAGTKASPSS